MKHTLNEKLFFVNGHPLVHKGRLHIHEKTTAGEKARRASSKNLGAMAGKAVDTCAAALREGDVGKAMRMFGIAQGLLDMALTPARQQREGCSFDDLVPLAREIKARMGEVVDSLIPYVKKSKLRPWYVKYGGVQPKI